MRLPLVFVPVIVVRVLLIVSYPLNLLKTDGANYLEMLIRGVSNLILAPGYPFIMGLLWRNPIGLWLVNSHPETFERLLCLSQQLVNVICIYLAYRVVLDVFGRLAASIFVILYGLHFQILAVSSSSSPEWLQGSLVMLMMFVLHRAYIAVGNLRKTFLYGLCGFVLCWLYLVKFNSIALLWLPGLALGAEVFRWCRIEVVSLRRFQAGMVDEPNTTEVGGERSADKGRPSSSYVRRAFGCFNLVSGSGQWNPLIAGAVGLAVFLGTYSVFLVAFHYPTTGTFTITMDKACILLQRVGLLTHRSNMSPDIGINTKRLLVLNALLPSPDHYRLPIPRVDWVSAEVRAPYRKRYSYLLTADEETLDQVGENLDLTRSFNFGRAYLPVGYYIGLPEANRLGESVFFEYVRAYPALYLKSIWRQTLKSMTEPKSHWIYPLSVKTEGWESLAWGFSEMKRRPRRSEFFRYSRPVVWVPGVWLFGLLYSLWQFPPIWVPILIVISSLVLVRRMWCTHSLESSAVIYVVLAIGVFAFVVFSNAILHFRWKEVHPILPILCILGAVSITQLLTAIAKFHRKTRPYVRMRPHV
jgi:hypothetical protein